MQKWAKQTGFTIVELLIVIVVIAILAAITVVAYTGVQGQTNDAAVKSDIRNYAQQVLAYEAENGAFPIGAGNSVPVGLGTISAAKGSYNTSVNNLYYCTGSGTFAIAARSKSGTTWAYKHSAGGLQSYTGAWGASSNICPGLGISSPFTFSNGHDAVSGWFSWVRG